MESSDRDQGDGGLVVTSPPNTPKVLVRVPITKGEVSCTTLKCARVTYSKGKNIRISKDNGDDEYGPTITFCSTPKECARGGTWKTDLDGRERRKQSRKQSREEKNHFVNLCNQNS